MCRCTLVADDQSLWEFPLICSTEADDLYEQSTKLSERYGRELYAISPCLEMFRSAVARRDPDDWLDFATRAYRKQPPARRLE